MRIGIIGAMDVEIAAILKEMDDISISCAAGMTFHCGRIDAVEAVVVKSGVGKVNAALSVQILADRFDVTHIINTGVAGSLDNRINIGDIVVASEAMYHDMDATIFGYAPGEIPQMGRKTFPADPALRAAAAAAVRAAAPEINVYEGRIISGDQFIASRAVKDSLTEKFHACCAEMEGAAIAHACTVNDIPYVILRAISDKADESVSVSYDLFEAKAAEHCAKIVLYMIRNMAQGK